jgi:hypothetical protein
VSLDKQTVILACPTSIRWVKDADQILVVEERRGRLVVLRGAEAAVWDWLTLRYSYPQLVNLLAALQAIPGDEAESLLIEMLSAWQSSDLLEILEVDEATHG